MAARESSKDEFLAAHRRRSLKRGTSAHLKEEHRLKQIQVFTKWINAKIAPKIAAGALAPVADLVDDLRSGCVLYYVIEALADEPLAPKVGKCDLKGQNKAHHMANLSLVFRALKLYGVKTVNVGAPDVFEGHEYLVLGLCWSILTKFTAIQLAKDAEADGVAASSAGVKEKLIAWANRCVEPCGLEIRTLASDFRDGKAFLAILHGCDAASPYDPSGDARADAESAFARARDAYGVPELIGYDDVGDEQSVVAYLAELKARLPRGWAKRKLKHAVRSLKTVAALSRRVAAEPVAAEPAKPAIQFYGAHRLSVRVDDDEAKAGPRPPPPREPAPAPERAPPPPAPAPPPDRCDVLLPSPAHAPYRICVVEFAVPGQPNGGSDKGGDGRRVDSVPIANGVIRAGGACDVRTYDPAAHETFARAIKAYDALVVRVNPGQLSQAAGHAGLQDKFDALLEDFGAWGKPVWSSPEVQTKMGAKDALVKIANLKCGLPDTFAYYDAATFEARFKQTMAFQPRVLKQNRGSAGEGIWLCWLANEAKDGALDARDYPAKTLGAASLPDDAVLKLMEMSDNHVEYHTVREFLIFCTAGPGARGAGSWASTSPGEYLKGGVEAGGQLVDQRLLPRIAEGEVRVLMSGDACQAIIHKKPEGGLSAVGGNSVYTYYEPSDPKYKGLLDRLLYDVEHGLMETLGLAGEALPLLWTCDYIPKNPEGWAGDGDAPPELTEYVVGEFNCSCVGVSQFQAVCGGERTLADVPDADYAAGTRLADLMGRQAIRMLVRPAPRGRDRRSIVAEPADVLEQAEEADGCEELEPIDNSSCLRSNITYDAPFDYGCCGSQFFPGIF